MLVRKFEGVVRMNARAGEAITVFGPYDMWATGVAAEWIVRGDWVEFFGDGKVRRKDFPLAPEEAGLESASRPG
jgi:hypothetical protein